MLTLVSWGKISTTAAASSINLRVDNLWKQNKEKKWNKTRQKNNKQNATHMESLDSLSVQPFQSPPRFGKGVNSFAR